MLDYISTTEVDSSSSKASIKHSPLPVLETAEAAGPTTPSAPAWITISADDHLRALRALQDNDFSNEAAILALPRRRNKSQRPLLIRLAKELYPSLSDVAAAIRYDSLVIPAKATVRQMQRDRILAQLFPKNNKEGKLVKIQGPWAGQDFDPLDNNGPRAIAMPVTIGKAEDFEAIFSYLSLDEPFPSTELTEKPDFTFLGKDKIFTGKHGHELHWNTPLVEFHRGIVYEDGRLDLCKKVVGPIHIGKLMESLESNHHIRHFLLGNNVISTTGARSIAQFLEKYPNRMETWYLAGCHLTQHALSLLVPKMTASSTITNLWFKRNPFGAGSASLLAELVIGTAHLRTLDLETVELGDEGTRQFIDAITGHRTELKHLYLNANGIGEKGCVSLGRYLADPNCVLDSLFLSTNPLGDAGMFHLAAGLAKNKNLKRFTVASSGLTGKGISYLSDALRDGDHSLHTLDLGASQTTKAHKQKFNYLDDASTEALKAIILLPSMRWLNLGRVVFTDPAFEDLKSAAARSELVHLDVHQVQVTGMSTSINGHSVLYDGAPSPRSCSLQLRRSLEKNQAKYYPHIKNYDEFLNSEEFRFLRNTSEVRKIDSMYRTLDKRLGLPMDEPWKENDPGWKLIVEDAEMARNT